MPKNGGFQIFDNTDLECSTNGPEDKSEKV
jgi:hypothetical protein